MRRVSVGCLAVLTAALLSGGCDQEINTTPTTPTNPTLVTETFAGTITPNGAQTFTFAITSAGTLTASLRTFGPDSITIGLALGTFNGVSCQHQIANDVLNIGQAVTGSASGAGTLCVRIYDARATVTQLNAFEILVIHP